MSYSQRDEEKWILEACANAPRRRLLDIGAFHPTCFSNSRALIEQGWDAVLVEPSPMPVRNLVKEYPQGVGFNGGMVNVMCAAVGLESGIITIHITDDAVSTSEVKPEWKERGGYLGAMTICQVTLEQLFHWYGDFGFVSIDTEGSSVDLFKKLLSYEMFPECICVEHDNRIVEASKAAQERGYRVIYTSEENLVFAKI